MTEFTNAELAEMVKQAHAVDSYRLYAAQLVHGAPPHLALECPHDECLDDGHDRCAKEETCLHNLLDDGQRRGPVELGALIDLATAHEIERAGSERPACSVVDVPGVGPTRVQGDGDLTDGGRQALGELMRAAQRKGVEDLKAQGRTELAERLAALRQTWLARQQKFSSLFEVVDGARAEAVDAGAELIGHMLAELDQAVNGG